MIMNKLTLFILLHGVGKRRSVYHRFGWGYSSPGGSDDWRRALRHAVPRRERPGVASGTCAPLDRHPLWIDRCDRVH